MRLILAVFVTLVFTTGWAADSVPTPQNPHGAGVPGAPATGAAPGGGAMGAMHSGMAKPPAISDVKVPKATGADARTVAEIVTGSAALKDKTAVQVS